MFWSFKNKKDKIVDKIDSSILFIVNYFYKNNRTLTQMHVHRILYFTQVLSIINDNDNPIYGESFEVTKFGPILPRAKKILVLAGSGPIYIDFIDLPEYNSNVLSSLSDKEIGIITEAIEIVLELGLEASFKFITEENGAWYKANKTKGIYSLIKNSDILEQFKSKLNNTNE